MNSGNDTPIALFRLLVVAAALTAAALAAARVYRLLTQQQVPGRCRPDDDYHYKDPHNHPNDC